MAENMAKRTKVAILGSGNIGTDLMMKVLRNGRHLEMGALAGIDPASDGLVRAARLGVATSADSIEGLRKLPVYKEIRIVFDATSAASHRRHSELIIADGKRVIDLTPAAVGPHVIPPVNLEDHLDARNLNMVTCGGQATVPMVAAVSRVARVIYAEIIASIASKSAGPGTRANIDEFTETTARAIESVGRAGRGKAIIILNPAEPSINMRDTVYCLAEGGDRDAIALSVKRMVQEVQTYVPGYKLKQEVQFEEVVPEKAIRIPGVDGPCHGLKVSIFLEVTGAAHYLPTYAGNLDIMTSAALRTAERLVELGTNVEAMR